jgi:ribulose-5-phosphate 4-epimerase/fuculose-1-phosphate aldolase
MNESIAKKQLVRRGKEIYDRGLVNGSGGNLSIRLSDRVICSPSGYSLGELSEEELSVTDLQGQVISGPKPTKELPMHLAVYRRRIDLNAVVHTHSIYAVTYACSEEVNTLIPAYIPSIVIKVGAVKLLPFRSPGSVELGELIEEEIANYNGLLLENHGVLAAGDTLEKAVISAYEIEDNLKIRYLSGRKARPLPLGFIEQINRSYRG